MPVHEWDEWEWTLFGERSQLGSERWAAGISGMEPSHGERASGFIGFVY